MYRRLLTQLLLITLGLFLAIGSWAHTEKHFSENNPIALSLSAVVTDEDCLDSGTGSIDLTVSGGSGNYTYAWSTSETTKDIAGLTGGDYTVTVTDTDTNETATQTFTVDSGFDLLQNANGNPKPVNCVNGSDGTLQLVITNGNGPYTYDWRDSEGNQVGNSSLLKDVTAGFYSVTVTGYSNDGDLCTASNTYLIEEPDPIFNITSDITNVSCNGLSDGAIDLTVTSPENGKISFDWTTIGSSDEDVEFLAAGEYEVVISQGKHCEIHTFTVIEPDVLTLSASPTDVLCSGDATGAIDLTVTGGTAPYTYEWGDGESTQDLSNLIAGTYNVEVTDSNGCTETLSVTVNESNVILVNATPVNVACGGEATGSIDLSVSGGSGTYTYLWTSDQLSSDATTEDISGLTAGDYEVVVTDGSGCTETLTVTVAEPSPIVINASQTNVDCNGNATGEIVLNVTGGTGAYTYSWGDGQTTKDLTGLSADTYTVIVEDASGCTATASVTITEPPVLSLSTAPTNVSCNGLADGSINLTVTGGAGGYSYLWSTGATTQDLSGLIADTYNVTVRDANGCEATTSVTITEPTAILVNPSQVNVTCKGDNDGSISVSVSGGSGSYTYQWDNGETTKDLSNLTADTYELTVTDDTGCSETITVTITEPATALTATATATDVSCNGGSDGTITLTVSNATGTVYYDWDHGPTTKDLTNVSAGSYTVTVTDDLGCITIANIEVAEPTPLVLTTTHTDVLCFGASTGTIDLTVSGGTAPYSYNWNTGFSTDEDPSGLPAGTYAVVVTDDNGCTETTSVTIDQPTELQVNIVATDATCNGATDGSLDLTATGGTAPYTFNWSTGSTDEDISGLAAGSYNVIVTDANGCKTGVSATVGEPAALSIAESITDAGCSGGSAGEIDITVTGGSGSYSYLWSNNATVEKLTGLTAGNYTVTVTDVNSNCTVSKTITVSETSAIDVEPTVKHIDCNGESTGEITLAAPGGGSYRYYWTDFPALDPETTTGVVGIPAGNYEVVVEDTDSGCTTNLTISVNEPAPITINSSKNDVSCFGGANGSINIIVSGGSGSYIYSWDDDASSNTSSVTGLSARSYTVTVTDNNASGCSATKTIEIVEPTEVTYDNNITDADCSGSATGSIEITNTQGGTGPYTYSWRSGGTEISTNQNLENVVAGTYELFVTDASGCSISDSFTIGEPAPITLSTTQVNVACNGESTGSIELTASGGTGTLHFDWNGGAFDTEDISGLTAGTYTVVVTDDSGCTATTAVTITEEAAISITADVTDIVCAGDATGAIDLTVTGGEGTYSFEWNHDNTETRKDITGIAAGDYEVTVTDGSGCTTVATFTVNEPPAITLSATQVNVTCNGGADGSINLTASGGTGLLSFSWTGGATTEDLSGLSAGVYTVIVTDGVGCSEPLEVTITEPDPISITPVVTDVFCKGQDDGAIDLAVSGGTAPYTYAWDNGATTKDISGLEAGNYKVTITDASGCTFTSGNIAVSEPPTNLNATAIATDISCNGANDGSIDLTASGGTGTLSYIWSNGEITEDVSGLVAGTYSVTITDDLGCVLIEDIVVDEPDVLTLSTDATNVDCNGNASGAINLTVTGGTAPFTYNWNSGMSTNQDLSGVSAGSYDVLVTDANGCTATTSVTITEPNALTLSAVSENVSCSGGVDGSINLTVSGGQGPYTYAWNNGATNQDLTSISAGNYSVTVTDQNNCTATFSTVVTEPFTSISATTSATNIACKGSSDGAIDLTVTGGTAPYTYEWDFGATTEDVSSLPAGSYTVTIYDANSCLTITGITISEPAAPITVNAAVTDVECFGDTNGAINISVSGGTAPYTYVWDSGENTQDISGKAAGTYMLTTTDANGCSTATTVTIAEPSELILSVNKTDILCNGEETGALDLTITGGTGPFNISWSNGENSEDIADLAAGNYTVTVTDANGCEETLTEQIIEPAAISLSATVVDAGCNGGTDGEIDLTVSGGNGPYTYVWNSGQTTQDLTGLAFGAYTVTVTDANGCTEDLVVNVNEDPNFSLWMTSTDVSCFGGSDGAINLATTGGTAPFTYTWSNGQTTEDISGLAAGIYTVEVEDAAGCSAVFQAEIFEPEDISVVASTTDILCNGSTDGALTLTLEGGTALYNINLAVNPGVDIQAEITDANSCAVAVFGIRGLDPNDINGANATATGNQVTVTGLPAGDFEIFRPDQGNVVLSTETIVEPSAIAVTETITDVSCNGGGDGIIALSTSGGSGNYTYNWSNGATTATVRNLSSGTYSVDITDVNGCTIKESYTITEPAALNIPAGVQDVQCFGASNGSINVVASGGTGPYTYAWSNGSTNNLISNIAAGNYSVQVTDANGCTAEQTFTITQPAALLANAVASDLSCFEDGTGGIDLTVTGGTGPFTYAWSNGKITEDISGLMAGSYTVLITDAKGCIIQETVNVSQPQELLVTGTSTDISCFGANDGAIDLNITGGTGGYQVLWNNGAITEDLSNLAAGTYSVTITDDNNCSVNTSFTINEPAELIITATQQDILCAGELSGSIDLSVSGGTGAYQIVWSNGAQTEDIQDLAAGTYNVTVTDESGCAVTASYTLSEPAVLELELAGTDLSCFQANDGEVVATISGGVAPYTYQWSNGETTQNLSALEAGFYALTVTDANGCSINRSVVITEPPILTTNGTSTDISCFGANDGTIDITVAGGTAPYQYLWNNGATNEDLTGLSAGDYSVQITDANGCQQSLDFTITAPSEIVATASKQDVLCAGASTGSIDLSVSGGTGPYQIEWSHGEQGESIDDLTAGNYVATITDANDCSTNITITVVEPDPIVLSASATNILCNGELNGAVDLAVTGGVAPYTFNWSNGESTQNIDQLSAGTYSVTVTDANNCTEQTMVTIMEPPVLEANLVQQIEVDCENGRAMDLVTVMPSGGSGNYQYSWNGAPFNSVSEMEFLRDGSYEVIVSDGNNCDVQLNFNVTLPEVGESEMFLEGTLDPYGAYTLNTPILFTAEHTDNITSIEWDLGDGTTSTEATFEHTYAKVGQYIVVLTTTDSNGCVLTHELTITVDLGYEIVMPNAFTPNMDGLNDRLYPEFYGIEDIRLVIFNNWGEVVFVSETIESGGWNGSLNNDDAPAGGYAYKLYATSISGESIERTGSFVLIKK